ncbi:MAG: hypothetical protein WBO55_08690 [Rhizobiaceae bacterium]
MTSSCLRYPAMLLAFLVLASMANAMDGATFLAINKERLTEEGVQIAVGSIVDGEPGSFSLLDVSVTLEADQPPMTIDRLEVTNPQEIGDELVVERIGYFGISSLRRSPSGEELLIQVESVTGENFVMQTIGDTRGFLPVEGAARLTVRNIKLTRDGKPLGDIPLVESSTTRLDGTQTYRFATQALDIRPAVSAIDSPGFVAQMNATGLSEPVLNILLKAEWDAETGRIAIEEYSLDMPDAMRIDLSMMLEGITVDVSREISDARKERQQAIAINPDALPAASQRMMSALGELKLSQARLKVTNHALASKLLDVQAAAMGVSRADMVMMVPTMVGGMLESLGSPELVEKASGALSKFVSDPRNFTITLTPREPLAFTQIMGTAISGPQTLPPLLGLDFSANE